MARVIQFRIIGNIDKRFIFILFPQAILIRVKKQVCLSHCMVLWYNFIRYACMLVQVLLCNVDYFQFLCFLSSVESYSRPLILFAFYIFSYALRQLNNCCWHRFEKTFWHAELCYKLFHEEVTRKPMPEYKIVKGWMEWKIKIVSLMHGLGNKKKFHPVNKKVIKSQYSEFKTNNTW